MLGILSYQQKRDRHKKQDWGYFRGRSFSLPHYTSSFNHSGHHLDSRLFCDSGCTCVDFSNCRNAGCGQRVSLLTTNLEAEIQDHTLPHLGRQSLACLFLQGAWDCSDSLTIIQWPEHRGECQADLLSSHYMSVLVTLAQTNHLLFSGDITGTAPEYKGMFGWLTWGLGIQSNRGFWEELLKSSCFPNEASEWKFPLKDKGWDNNRSKPVQKRENVLFIAFTLIHNLMSRDSPKHVLSTKKQMRLRLLWFLYSINT